jgi:hypothetical protein
MRDIDVVWPINRPGRQGNKPQRHNALDARPERCTPDNLTTEQSRLGSGAAAGELTAQCGWTGSWANEATGNEAGVRVSEPRVSDASTSCLLTGGGVRMWKSPGDVETPGYLT